MTLEFLKLGSYGIFVWPAFIFAFTLCLTLYLKTKKEFEEQQKVFLKHFREVKVEEGKPIKEALATN